ncbi:multidrug resistance-associated ABC transporter [Pilatotrama ljubarskyi]|nr:multidrug resistance-associated ABC transporter [Pilatotrama ljubarskyi]
MHMTQTILAYARPDASASIDSQIVLPLGTGLSVIVLLLQMSARSSLSPKRTVEPAAEHNGTRSSRMTQRVGFQVFVAQSGGRAVLVYKLLRLLACVSLLCLSIVTASINARGLGGGRATTLWTRFVQCEVYAYSTALALASVLLPGHGFTPALSGHLSFVLLLTWAVYLYRDVLPLATTIMRPMDADEGLLLWIKLGILTGAAVIIPMFIPRSPDSDTEVAEPLTKEQKAGWYSRRMFSWLNETVAKAYRVNHIPLEELPPLASTDRTKHLVDDSLKYLDPLETRQDTHIFWGFLRLFRQQYAVGAVLTILASLLGLSWPVATQGLLASLEERHAEPVVRPWAWVLLLFIGPTVKTVCEEWYYWIMNRMSVRTEAIITELLFQHALRIRVKSETAGSGQDEGTAAGTSEQAAQAPEAPKNDFLVGKLNNLITSDLENVTEGNKQWLLALFQTPLRIAVAIVFMYSVLGWSALVGLATLLALIPLPGYLSGWIQTFQKKRMDKTDARVQSINEVLNVVRMIKLFGWERRVSAQIDERREAELAYIRMTRWLEIVNNLFNYSIPLITMAVTFTAYTVLMKGELTASKLFSSNAAFMLIQQEMHQIFFMIPRITQGRVSIDRINSFLHEARTELLDEFAATNDRAPAPPEYVRPSHDEDVLGIKRTSFTWTYDAEPQTPASTASSERQSRKYVLNIDGELLFKRGRINLIVGPTGSGKTSLLMALLGEMHAKPSGPDSFVSLPRSGGVAYAAQESWVLSDTIRNNILFGAPYDEARYAKVIKQCALERDFSLFEAGDKTEVGEKGITLSGGQKARITLARAVYSSAEILLLDDVLAALDVHTGQWIVDKCFKEGLVRRRTVLLVSHNVALVRPIAEFVVALGADGRIASQGSLEKTLQEDHELLDEIKTEEEQLKRVEQAVAKPELPADDDSQKGKLVVAEEIAEGQVGWSALRLYVMNASKAPVLYWLAVTILLIATHSIMNTQTYILGLWANEYEKRAPSEVPVAHYLGLYGLSVLGTVVAYATFWLFFVTGANRASRIIHTELVTSVLGTTLRWLDMTPTSRVVARCTVDMQTIDITIPKQVFYMVESSVYLLLRVGAAAIMAPLFILPAAIVGVAGASLGWIYLKAQICVKREMSNARAPVLGHFGSAVAGIVSIRAYGAQDHFKRESYARVDKYSRAAFIYSGLNRWITVRADIMGSALTALLAGYLVYVSRLSASNAGFAMIMAVGFSANILYWVRLINDLMLSANRHVNLERVQQYFTIEHEPKPTSTGVPPAYWPASGELRVEKLSARYSPDGPSVLHEISFEVKSGERIGIVGRTGSGKSSLTLALLRCILTEGKVYYDGIATDSINLDALRSNITIIPQTPELLSGTLRKNLDPFEQHDDSTLNDALRSAGLFSLQDDEGNARLTLDTEIAGGGSNLSVGQRQILALARAMVRRSKLLILDEATSAIDYETDAIIQNTLRSELGRDVTVLTVAHRLQSIMDADKIMVLDAGRIVEYDAPRRLLEKEDGHFRSLVDGSGDKEALYARAGLTPNDV